MKERTSGLLGKKASGEKTKEKQLLSLKRRRRSCRRCMAGEEHDMCERSGRSRYLKELLRMKKAIRANGLMKEMGRPIFRSPVVSLSVIGTGEVEMKRSNIIHFPQPNRRIA